MTDSFFVQGVAFKKALSSAPKRPCSSRRCVVAPVDARARASPAAVERRTTT